MRYITLDNKKLRIIDAGEISDVVRSLFIDINHRLTEDVVEVITDSASRETHPVGKQVLCRLCDNLVAARELDVPICQDTGMAILFAEIGEDVHVLGDTFDNAVNEGVRRAYLEGKMRLSVVRDPLYDRTNTNDNTPAVIHTTFVKGDRIKLTASPKGFGSENMSTVRMLTPSATEEDIIRIICEWVKKCGSNPCPPIVVGVGIGGDFEYCATLAKKALTRPLNDEHPDNRYASLEQKILREINKLGIGPQGFGGDTTALAVKIEAAPTHIAGLPVAININCHVARHKTAVI